MIQRVSCPASSFLFFSFLSRDRSIELLKNRLANDLKNQNTYYKTFVDSVSINTPPPLTMAQWNEIVLVILGLFGAFWACLAALVAWTTWHKWYCETLQAAADNENWPAAAREELRARLEEDIQARLKGFVPYILWNLSFAVPGFVRSAWVRLASRGPGRDNSSPANLLRQAEEGRVPPKLSLNLSPRSSLKLETASQTTHHADPQLAKRAGYKSDEIDPTTGN